MASISRSGGYEGSYESIALGGGGGSVSYSYQMYTIPDSISISTDKGVIFSSGFVSGGSSGTLQIPVGAESLTIRLATNDEGTAWDYSVNVKEQHCAVLQDQYAQAYSRYIAARDYYNQQTRVDISTQIQNISDLQTLLNQSDQALAWTGISTIAGTINGVLGIFYPNLGVINEYSDLANLLIGSVRQNGSITDSFIDFTQYAAGELAKHTPEGVPFLSNLSSAIGIANLEIDSIQAYNQVQELIDLRFEINDRLQQAKQDLITAQNYQADHDAKRASLIEKYEIANDLYEQLTGECPPTGVSAPGGSGARVMSVESLDSSTPNFSLAAVQTSSADDFNQVVTTPIKYYDGQYNSQSIIGTSNADNIVEQSFKAFIHAGGGDDTILTGQQSDVVFGGQGDDVIDVSGGFDVVGFSGRKDEYTIEEVSSGTYRVSDSVAGRDGVDLVSNAEVFAFSNGGYHLNPVSPPSIRVSDVTAVEDSGELVFYIQAGRLSDQDITVPWEISAGTADATDATFGSGIATIRAGETVAEVRLTITPDTVKESNETVKLTLGQPTNAFLLKPGVAATGTIIDDEGSADLFISRVDGVIDSVNQTATYTLQVTNLGTTTAEDVKLREIFDLGTHALSFHASKGSASVDYTLNQLEAMIGSLGVNETATVDVSLSLLGAGTFIGIAQAATSTLETNLEDNLLYSTTVIAPTALQPIDLSLTTAADVSQVRVGDNVTFTVSLNNAGPGIASNIQVSSLLPQGYDLLYASADQGTFNASTGVWDAGNIRDGVTRNLTLHTVATTSAGGSLVAEVIRADEPDVDSTAGNGVRTEDDFSIYTIAPFAGSNSSADENPMVDDAFYLARNPDVAASGMDADAHFALFGAQEGRNPNAFFSTKEYLAANPDVAKAGVNALTHYMQFGAHEGRDPSASFDNELYLARNPDVKASGLNPLEHYIGFGQNEGRQIYEAVGRQSDIKSGFDAEFYLLSNGDVAAAALKAGGDTFLFAKQHFEDFGWHEGRDPNAVFDTSGYLAAYADVNQAGLNPLTHYEMNGWHEGRDPAANFDTASYLSSHADVALSGISPMDHYLQFGLLEGRTAVDDGSFRII